MTGLPNLPVLRVPDECAYYKEDAGYLGRLNQLKAMGYGGYSRRF